MMLDGRAHQTSDKSLIINSAEKMLLFRIKFGKLHQFSDLKICLPSHLLDFCVVNISPINIRSNIKQQGSV